MPGEEEIPGGGKGTSASCPALFENLFALGSWGLTNDLPAGGRKRMKETESKRANRMGRGGAGRKRNYIAKVLLNTQFEICNSQLESFKG